MAKSTFVKCWLNGVDISESIESLRYETDVKKGDFVEIRCKSDKALDLANNKNMVAGAKIEYQYGLIGGVQSSMRLARVGNIEVSYDTSRVQLTIRATDKGIEIKKGGGNRIWKNVKLSDIAAQIATGYGLTADKITPTVINHASIPQGSFSDWEFLNYLILKEPTALQLYVDGVDLILEKNTRDKKSRRLYTLGENIISFRTALKEISQKPSLASPSNGTGGGGQGAANPIISQDKTIQSFGFSVNGGKVYTKEVERGLREWESKDGRFTVDKIKSLETRNGKSEVVNSQTVTSKVETKTFVDSNGNITHRDIYTPYSPNESQTTIQQVNEENKQKVLTGDLKIELDPFILVRDVITLSLPVERHSGNWYIEKCTHTVDGNGAITELSLNKNGVFANVKSGGSATKDKVNNSTGTPQTKEVGKVKYSGVSGLEVQGNGVNGIQKVKIN